MGFRAKASGLLCLTALAACVSQDEPPVHVTIAYQLRCVADDGCFYNQPAPQHDVNGVNGSGGLTADCEGGSTVDDFSFLAVFDLYEIRVTVTETECTVEVQEEVNAYRKTCEVVEVEDALVDCYASAQNPQLPCQLAYSRAGDTVSGTLCCRNMPVGEFAAAKLGDLSLLEPNTEDQPVSFEIEHCR